MADINVIVLPDGTEYPVSDYYIPVAISNPTDGQVLKYDATNGVWYNGDDTEGSSVFYGTSAPASQLGVNGNLYVKYTEGTGGASDTVDALYVKLDDSWCQISTGGGGGASSADQVSFDDTDVAFEADDAQEAFENITKSLTWAEYQQLTSAEKNNGTIYLITDVNGDGQNFQPVIYSEEEREIGVWTDGKPLYERVIDLEADTSISYNSWTLTTVSLSGIDRLVLIQGLNSSGTAFFGDLLGGNNNDYLQLQTSRNGDTVAVRYLIFRYTKTTDVAGSGTWTPQGVPAVHYSTDEHVIGTWVDGKTLYEKTVTNIALTHNTWTTIFDGSSIGATIVEYEGTISLDGTSPFSHLNYYRAQSEFSVSMITDSGSILKVLANIVNPEKLLWATIRYTKTS